MELLKNVFWKQDIILNELENRLFDFEIFSFDIFETIIFRKYRNPNDLHLTVYQKSLEKGYINLSIGAKYYTEVRMRAQAFAKKNSLKEEITFDEIFQYIPSHFGNLQAIKQLEYQLDRESLYPNPIIMSLIGTLKALNKKIVFVSNMYYSKKQLEELLTFVGIKKADYDELFVSSEYGVLKDTGKLFNEVLKFYSGIKPTSIIHIGDNYSADYLGAKRLNIEALHYPIKEIRLETAVDLEYLFYGNKNDDIYMLRKSLELNKNVKENDYFRIGALIIGPVLFTFISKCLQEILNKSVELVLPLMREGAILTEIINLIIEKNNIDLCINPLYVSRRATFFPAKITKWSAQEFLVIFEEIDITVQDIYKLFAFSSAKYKNINKNLYDLKQDNTELYALIKEEFINLFSNSDKYYLKEQQKLLKEYITNNLAPYSKIATIDIGFNGTIQESLEDVLSIDDSFDITHFIYFAREGIINKVLKGMQIINIAAEVENSILSDIVRSVEVFEQLLMGTAGSTLFYQKKIDKVTPVCETINYDESEVNARNAVFEGIIYYTECILSTDSFFDNNIGTREEIIHRLIKYPLKSEADSLGDLSFCLDFGNNQYSKIIDTEILQSVTSDSLIGNTSYLANKICWPSGIQSLKNDRYIIDSIPNLERNKLIKNLGLHFTQDTDSIVVYGAGEVGRKVIEALNFLGISPIYIVDRNEKLHGTFINGIEIKEVENLSHLIEGSIVIASYTFAKEIESYLIKVFENNKLKPSIVRID